MKKFLRLLGSQASIITYVAMLVIVVIVMFNFSRWRDKDLISNDTISYYAYLPATFIHHDITLRFIDDDRNYWEDKIWYESAPNGGRVIKMTMGVAYCYAPFFLIGDAWAHMGGYTTDGYSFPYKMMLMWSNIFYTFLGLYFLRKLLRVWFYSEALISVVLLVILFGTNLYNYVTYNHIMSHTYSFALITLFLWFTEKWHRRPSIFRSVIVGILAGWITLIRPLNILVVLIFIGYGMFSFMSIVERLRYFIIHFRHILIILLLAFLVILPQLIYWKTVSGNWLFYSYIGEHFYFSKPKILEGLFSWRKGWLLYTPVMLLSIAGIFFLRRTVRELTVAYPILFILLIYTTFSWWCWWYGGSFGQRTLVDWYGLMALPIAAVLYKLQSSKWSWRITFVVLLFVVAWSQIQHMQYRYNSIHFDAMTRKAYFYNIGRIKKRPGVEELIKAPDYPTAMRGEREYFWE